MRPQALSAAELGFLGTLSSPLFVQLLRRWRSFPPSKGRRRRGERAASSLAECTPSSSSIFPLSPRKCCTLSSSPVLLPLIGHRRRVASRKSAAYAAAGGPSSRSNYGQQQPDGEAGWWRRGGSGGDSRVGGGGIGGGGPNSHWDSGEKDYVTVNFSVKAPLEPGQVLYLGGVVPELGGWEVRRALRMDRIGDTLWGVQVRLPAAETIYYRYLVSNGDIAEGARAVWHRGGNRRVILPLDRPELDLQDDWDNADAAMSLLAPSSAASRSPSPSCFAPSRQRGGAAAGSPSSVARGSSDGADWAYREANPPPQPPSPHRDGAPDGPRGLRGSPPLVSRAWPAQRRDEYGDDDEEEPDSWAAYRVHEDPSVSEGPVSYGNDWYDDGGRARGGRGSRYGRSRTPGRSPTPRDTDDLEGPSYAKEAAPQRGGGGWSRAESRGGESAASWNRRTDGRPSGVAPPEGGGEEYDGGGRDRRSGRRTPTLSPSRGGARGALGTGAAEAAAAATAAALSAFGEATAAGAEKTAVRDGAVKARLLKVVLGADGSAADGDEVEDSSNSDCLAAFDVDEWLPSQADEAGPLDHPVRASAGAAGGQLVDEATAAGTEQPLREERDDGGDQGLAAAGVQAGGRPATAAITASAAPSAGDDEAAFPPDPAGSPASTGGNAEGEDDWLLVDYAPKPLPVLGEDDWQAGGEWTNPGGQSGGRGGSRFPEAFDAADSAGPAATVPSAAAAATTASPSSLPGAAARGDHAWGKDSATGGVSGGRREHPPTVVGWRVAPTLRGDDRIVDAPRLLPETPPDAALADEPVTEILINAASTVWTRVVILENGEPVEVLQEAANGQLNIGDVYLAEVMPAMKAVFVDIGGQRNALLDTGFELCYVVPSSSTADPGSENDFDAVGTTPQLRHSGREGSWEHFVVGSSVIVQVKKEPIGNKGARVTARPSLAGRYLVLFPGLSSLGISRKIAGNERNRLRTVIERLRPEGYGVVARTEAVGASNKELERDLEGLRLTWLQILERAAEVSAPALLHKAMGITGSIVRDLFTDKVNRLVVDTRHEFLQIQSYLEQTAPQMLGKLEFYRGAEPLFDAFGISDRVDAMEESRVPLPGGGYLVIQQTEALVAVDVNGGRDVLRSTDGSMDDAVLAVNLEAARRIAQEVRLRDIGGIIVIDFIDMNYTENRRQVEEEMRKAISRDRSRPRFTAISDFGLMEMTRLRVRPSVNFWTSNACTVCGGAGRLPSFDSTLSHLEHAIRRWQADFQHPERRPEQGMKSSQWPRLVLRMGRRLAEYAKEDNKRRLKAICFSCRVTFTMEVDSSLGDGDCQLFEAATRGRTRSTQLIAEWTRRRE